MSRSNLKKSKKGLTPIIAVILLLMMTVAAAGAAFFWFIRVQGELQGGSEQYSQELSEKVSSNVDTILAQYNQYTGYASGVKTHFGNITFLVRNTGSAKVPLTNSSSPPTTTWILQDSDQNIICSEDWANSPSICQSGCGADLGVSGIATIILNTSGACDIGNTTTYPNNSLFYFKIDFSGQTATGGSFRK